MDYAALFSGLDDATVQERLPSLVDKDGTHKLRVDVHKAIKGTSGLSFIAECTILATNSPRAQEGERASIICGGLSEATEWKRNSALGRLKAHVAAVYMLSPETQQNWIGLIQFACEHGVTKGATFVVQSRTVRKAPTADKPAPKPFVEYAYGLDPENPIQNHPTMAAFYQALKAAG